jgi:hypothetical protein
MSLQFRPGVHAIPAMHSLHIEQFPWDFGRSLRAAWNYVQGKEEPHYSVPAIRQGFEFGRDLQNNRVTLLHWQQGVYEEGT